MWLLVVEDSDEESDENLRISPQPDSDVETENEDVVPLQTTWRRTVVPRSNSSRKDIYYYEEGKSKWLRSLNEVKDYCQRENLNFDRSLFSFEGKNTFEGIVNPKPSTSGIQTKPKHSLNES